jgi:hypothetical protein
LHNDAELEAADLVAVFVQPIDGGLHVLQHAGFANRLHDADNRIPVTFFTCISKLEPPAERRLALEMAGGKRLVDDGQGQRGRLVRRAEESAFVQRRANGGEVVAAHVTNERDLLRDLVPRLPVEPIEGRVGGVRERNATDRTGVDHARNGAHGLHLGVDEGDAPLEILVAEERSLER